MDVPVKLTVPSCIYQFYGEAATHIADSSPEQVMSDALTAYAGLLSKDIARALTASPEPEFQFPAGNISASKSR